MAKKEIVYECGYVRTCGKKCEGPALRGKSLCYFHHKQHLRHLQMAALPSLPPPADGGPAPISIPIPMLEDADAIQVAIHTIASALGTNQIETARARAILYALQIASSNRRSDSVDLQYSVKSAVKELLTGDDGIELSAERYRFD